MTSANARVALGLSGATGCFNSAGTFVSSCGQAYDGVVTLTTSFTLNDGTTPNPGEYSAVSAAEHEIDEMLGGGGQGSTLNAIAYCNANPTDPDCIANADYTNDIGVLDPYRYSAPGVKSFTTSTTASTPYHTAAQVRLVRSQTGDPPGRPVQRSLQRRQLSHRAASTAATNSVNSTCYNSNIQIFSADPSAYWIN